MTSNKCKIDHTFGLSGLLSIELGVADATTISFSDSVSRKTKIMVNAVGFGGNAVSILSGK
ncbi:MAG: hypothetical protein RBR78_03495 [Flavobacteriaceae bacterium]|nr:hypothetical protein [Flavobacteriaceae bacterium]HTO36687.1 hypothetical protein [Flavobacterium sp.]